MSYRNAVLPTRFTGRRIVPLAIAPCCEYSGIYLCIRVVGFFYTSLTDTKPPDTRVSWQLQNCLEFGSPLNLLFTYTTIQAFCVYYRRTDVQSRDRYYILNGIKTRTGGRNPCRLVNMIQFLFCSLPHVQIGQKIYHLVPMITQIFQNLDGAIFALILPGTDIAVAGGMHCKFFSTK